MHSHELAMSHAMRERCEYDETHVTASDDTLVALNPLKHCNDLCFTQTMKNVIINDAIGAAIVVVTIKIH